MFGLLDLIPTAVSAVKSLLEKKNPELAKTLDEALSDPKTKLELEKIALEKMRLQQNTEKWELDDRADARALAKIDMTSDSWLSKNVRPIVLIFLTTMFVIAFFLSAKSAFQFDKDMVTLFKNLLAWVYAFYFGGRSLEKVTKIIRG